MAPLKTLALKVPYYTNLQIVIFHPKLHNAGVATNLKEVSLSIGVLCDITKEWWYLELRLVHIFNTFIGRCWLTEIAFVQGGETGHKK